MFTSETKADVCILGAGPHGLAAAVHLREADPELEIVVVDHASGWLQTWNEQFARAEIATLRSPMVRSSQALQIPLITKTRTFEGTQWTSPITLIQQPC